MEPLKIEDYVVQASPDVSPMKWHLAHTTWFFERFVLTPFSPAYRLFHPGFDHLFNSYYETVGKPFPRSERGWLSRPTVKEIWGYRQYVEEHVEKLLLDNSTPLYSVWPTIEIGIHHEQQHQELMLTDLKYNFYVNPLKPVYRECASRQARPNTNNSFEWETFDGGLVEIGHDGQGFAFDNEGPRHKLWLEPYRLASRPVTNGEFLAFMEDGGYHEVSYWLSDGWTTVRREGWRAPLYWEQIDGEWYYFTLSGMRAVDEREPVTHISFYEADAYARWAEKRLPTEAEWENAFASCKIKGNFADTRYYHPCADETGGVESVYGDVWEWTASPYVPYPGNTPLEGALGEYNAKFMANQMVLRGGSCVTPASHIRPTYRNFFQPDKRWQFSGLRLAEGC